MYNPYDIDAFLEEISGLSYHDIIKECNKKSFGAEQQSYNTAGAVNARKNGSESFFSLIGDLLFLLQNGMRPSGISDFNFFKFKPIITILVNNKELNKEALDVFNKDNKK